MLLKSSLSRTYGTFSIKLLHLWPFVSPIRMAVYAASFWSCVGYLELCNKIHQERLLVINVVLVFCFMDSSRKHLISPPTPHIFILEVKHIVLIG